MMAAANMGTNLVARELDVRPATVTKWRTRSARLGLDGLRDAPRPGKSLRYTPQDEKRVLQMLDQPPPSGYAQWNGSLLARALSLPADYVWKGLRTHGIQLERRRSWLNHVEVRFSLLSRYALEGASFTSPRDLGRAIDRFTAACNPAAHPFQWTREVVHPKGLKRCYADLGR